jgi:uncharacterized membrane protein
MNIYSNWIGSLPMPSLHGGADDSSGGLAGLMDSLLGAVTNLVESGATISLFPGIRALAANVHPLIVHFPIAFLSAYLLLELFGVGLRRPSLRQLASWMLYLGAIGAAGAAGAGLLAASMVPHGGEVHELMEWHQGLMLAVTALAVVLALVRAFGGIAESAMAAGLSLFLGAVMMALMVGGTDLGGLMVYEYGVGVHSLQAQEDVSDHVHGGGGSAEVPPTSDLAHVKR